MLRQNEEEIVGLAFIIKTLLFLSTVAATLEFISIFRVSH